MNPRRNLKSYFPPESDAPAPLRARATRRVRFEELDPLRIVWHGRYVSYFEDGRVAFGRKYGLSYDQFMKTGIAAPIVSLHIDYMKPLSFDEEITIEATLHWSTALRLNFEFTVLESSGIPAAKGYTIQLLTDLKGTVLFAAPNWIEEFRNQWQQNSFSPTAET